MRYCGFDAILPPFGSEFVDFTASTPSRSDPLGVDFHCIIILIYVPNEKEDNQGLHCMQAQTKMRASVGFGDLRSEWECDQKKEGCAGKSTEVIRSRRSMVILLVALCILGYTTAQQNFLVGAGIHDM